MLSDFNQTCIFSTDFRKNSHGKCNENPSVASPVSWVLQTDRQTDRNTMELIVAIRKSANTTKMIVNSEYLTTFIEKMLEYFILYSDTPRYRLMYPIKELSGQ